MLAVGDGVMTFTMTSNRSWLNPHVFLDRLLVDWIGGVVTRIMRSPLYFSETVDSPSFAEHLAAIQIALPVIEGVGHHELQVDTLAGEMEAAVRVLHWQGPEAATIIHHHGGSEHPFDQTIKRIFPLNKAAPGNVVAVRSPFHTSSMGVLTAGASMSRYVALMAVAVAVTEALLTQSVLGENGRTLVSGVSLGSFTANRHHLVYNSAGAYLPIHGGTKHGDIFVARPDLTDAQAFKQPEAIRRALNFDETWATRSHDNVFGVMARFDTLHLYEVQRPSYGDMPVETWDTAHLSTILAYGRLRQKIIRHLQDLR